MGKNSRRIAFVSLAVLAAVSTPAHAQGYPGFGVPPGWDLFGESVNCSLAPKWDRDASSYRGPALIKRQNEPSRLQFQLYTDMGEVDQQTQLAFVIDGKTFPATFDRAMGRAVISPVPSAFDRAYRAGQRLSVTVDGKEVYQMSLAGSAAAMRALDRCVAEVEVKPLPMVPMIRTVPAPPPPVPVKRIPPPAPPSPPPPPPKPTLARSAVAINPGLWIGEGDYPKSALRAEEEGLVGYQLDIRKSGSVKRCTVTRSSGSAELDERTCKRVKSRARFEPALDEKGKRTVGSYIGSVRWTLPY